MLYPFVHLLQGVVDEVDRRGQGLVDRQLANEPVVQLEPKIDLLGQSLVVDDDEQIEVRPIALGGVRLIDPAATRIAAIEDDLVDPALLLPAHRAERERVLKLFEDDLLHAFKFALLVRWKMIEVGFHAGGTLSRRWRIGKVEAPSAAPELPPRPVLFFGLAVSSEERRVGKGGVRPG